MKIVFVSDAIYPYNKGGKEKRLYELSTRLARIGHDVHIYTMHWWKTPEQSRVENGVTLHAICKYYPMYNGERRSIKEGIMFGLACFKLFKVQFDALDVDHMPFFPVFSAWIVCKLRGRKFHGTWHEALSTQDWVNYMGKSGYIASVIERMSIKMPHAITASSPHTQKLLGEIHGRKNGIALVTPGIDIAQMNSVKPAKVNCDVLYVGRLVKDKNIDKLIEAVGIIAQTNPKIRCIIIGHGVEKPQLAKLITKLKLQKQVQLLDPLPEAEQVYGYMKAAKVFCLPSVREGFGMVVLEALGCGTPVITIDAPANAAKDLITDGVNGSVVALKPGAIADAIAEWMSKGRAIDNAATAAYDWSALIRRQEEAYTA